jgi:hypothetical protein
MNGFTRQGIKLKLQSINKHYKALSYAWSAREIMPQKSMGCRKTISPQQFRNGERTMNIRTLL